MLVLKVLKTITIEFVFLPGGGGNKVPSMTKNRCLKLNKI